MGVAGGSEKVAPFFLGQAEACRRLMEDVSAENFIHTLFSQESQTLFTISSYHKYSASTDTSHL